MLIPEKVEALVFDSDCFLDVDMFHFLVALTMTLPSLQKEGGSEGQSAPLPIALASVPTGGLNDQYCLTLVFIVHLVQVMLTYDVPSQGRQSHLQIIELLHRKYLLSINCCCC